jgi:hypothetical protein
VQLRYHPLMSRKGGLKAWPPLWRATLPYNDNKLIGEIGILKDVMMSDQIDNKIFMFMQHEGFRYMGFLTFDDSPFCHEIYRLLKSNVGRSIKEIGDIDLSYTL